VRPALVLEHEPDAPAALLERWAAARGIELEVWQAGTAPPPDPAERPFVVALGSEASAYDEEVPWLRAERTALDRALEARVPVLGICFGAQHLARALGGSVAPAPRSEVGWMEVETLAPDVVPAGPWLQWHHDAFEPPPGAELLARSPLCAQAFRRGPHLGVQFHPEVTAAVVEDWARSYPASLERAGTSAPAVLADTERLAPAAQAAAARLFDAFLAAAREHGRRVPARPLG
jgi:GMP synthase-like glutamine amidotransferase